jgi:stage II sporulation protein AA (anti-sigma F factor antagonist)
MQMVCTVRGNALEIALTGELDHHEAKKLIMKLDNRIDAYMPKCVVFDLGGVTFMDSSGLAILMRAYKRMGAVDGSVRVEHIPDQAGKVIAAAGLNRIITIC